MNPLEVVSIGRMMFKVGSQSVPGHEYITDLTYNGGIGACDCPRFRCVYWPMIRDGRLTLKDTFPVHPDKHIQAARDNVELQMYGELSRREDRCPA